MNEAAKIYNNVMSDIWKNQILKIFNEDDLIIIYIWEYKEESGWHIQVDKTFLRFCIENHIKICDDHKDLLNLNKIPFKSFSFNRKQPGYRGFLFTKGDTYLINNKAMTSVNFNHNKQHVINFNPNFITPKIFSKACNIKKDNFFSFPVGIYERKIIDISLIKTKRIRTTESIKSLIFNNYLNINKNIINYIYFLQTATLNENSSKLNPFYVKICESCKNSKIFTHTTEQEAHWHNLNNHLFNLCLSWNTLESPRLWESLYFGCIPIVIDYYEKNDFVEQHYNDLPILYIKNIDDLFSEEFIQNKYKSIISNIDKYNFKKLRLTYWKNILKK